MLQIDLQNFQDNYLIWTNSFKAKFYFSFVNKSLRYIALLAILPLFTTGLRNDYFTDVDALKSKGTETSQYGSSTNICGLDLCSNYPGGKASWEAEQSGSTTPVAPVEEEHTEETTEVDVQMVEQSITL